MWCFSSKLAPTIFWLPILNNPVAAGLASVQHEIQNPCIPFRMLHLLLLEPPPDPYLRSNSLPHVQSLLGRETNRILKQPFSSYFPSRHLTVSAHYHKIGVNVLLVTYEKRSCHWPITWRAVFIQKYSCFRVWEALGNAGGMQRIRTAKGGISGTWESKPLHTWA